MYMACSAHQMSEHLTWGTGLSRPLQIYKIWISQSQLLQKKARTWDRIFSLRIWDILRKNCRKTSVNGKIAMTNLVDKIEDIQLKMPVNMTDKKEKRNKLS